MNRWIITSRKTWCGNTLWLWMCYNTFPETTIHICYDLCFNMSLANWNTVKYNISKLVTTRYYSTYVGVLHYIMTNHWIMYMNSNVEHLHTMKKRYICYELSTKLKMYCDNELLYVDILTRHQQDPGGTSNLIQQEFFEKIFFQDYVLLATFANVWRHKFKNLDFIWSIAAVYVWRVILYSEKPCHQVTVQLVLYSN